MIVSMLVGLIKSNSRTRVYQPREGIDLREGDVFVTDEDRD
jgi:hypothetical protein